MKARFIINRLFLGLAIATLITACSKMDDTYSGFVEGGEVPYSKRPDSIEMFPGHNRIGFSWLLISTPNVTECKVLWNNDQDSTSIPVDITKEVDSVHITIDGLEGGFYTFKFITVDQAGHRSIPKAITGRVYGNEYTSTLLNRQVSQALLFGGHPLLSWYDQQDTTAIGTEVSYIDPAGAAQRMIIPNDETLTTIPGSVQGDSVRIRTLFIPDSMAIDTFYSHYETLYLAEAEPQQLDKSAFSAFILPTDAPAWKSTYPMSNMWDDDIEGTSWYRTTNGSGVPHWFTIDLGTLTKLSSYTLWQRGGLTENNLIYANANAYQWEIWGSSDPNPDGSWDESWVKLMDCTSTKPSGSPMGTNTAEDIQHAIDGDTFTIPADAPIIRYIRIKITSTWDPSASDHCFISELSFFGIDL